MNILLLGVSGRTGRLVAQLALARGHAVTAVARKPPGVELSDRLELMIGRPLQVEDLTPLCAKKDAVISCLGQRSSQDRTLLFDAAQAALEAMSRNRVRRYLVVSHGLLFPDANPIVALQRLLLSRQINDFEAMERLVRRSNVAWTIVRPSRLKDGGPARGYRTSLGAKPLGQSAMQRLDLASFLVDEAEKGNFKTAMVGITSR